MKLCASIQEAIAEAADGGQGLFIQPVVGPTPGRRAPMIEKLRPRQTALLFDVDLARLKRTAVELGAVRVWVQSEGCRCQHTRLHGWAVLKAKHAARGNEQ